MAERTVQTLPSGWLMDLVRRTLEPDPRAQYGGLLPIKQNAPAEGLGASATPQRPGPPIAGTPFHMPAGMDYGLPDFVRGSLLGALDIAQGRMVVDEKGNPVRLTGEGLAALPVTGFGASLAERVAPGALGSFAGRRARTADTAALARAESMTSRGAPREEIFDTTGWFKGADGQWRFEIPDTNSNLRHGEGALLWEGSFEQPHTLTVDPSGVTMSSGERRPFHLSEILEHPELYEAYPKLQGVRVYPMPQDGLRIGARGSFFPESGRMELAPASPNSLHSTVLHEAGGHGVQGIEGFARGGDPEEFISPTDRFKIDFAKAEHETLTKQVTDLIGEDYIGNLEWATRRLITGKALEPRDVNALNSLPKELRDRYVAGYHGNFRATQQEAEAYEKYLSLAGEAEARNVQFRDMLRSQGSPALPYPWETTPARDIMEYRSPNQPIRTLSEAEQLIKFEGGGLPITPLPPALRPLLRGSQ